VSEPDARDLRIADLELRLAAALKENEELKARLAALEARLNQNSTNSHKPPSTDDASVERPKRKAKGKKRGGQYGHKANHRALLPVEACRKVIPYLPTECPCGSHAFSDAQLELRHQVIYLPKLVAPVDEHQSFSANCLDCGRVCTAPIPPEFLVSAFGPCVVALLVQLVGEYRLSRRSVQRLMEDLLGIEISLGSICDQEQTVSKALAAPVAEVYEAVKAASQANADETGWRVEKQKAVLWVAVVSGICCAFRIADKRDSKAAVTLLGKAFKGVLGTDRWASYNAVNAAFRQVCWAHLIRDFVSWDELDGEGGKLGEALLMQAEKMFKAWSWFKEKPGKERRAEFQIQMVPVRKRILELLHQAKDCSNPKVSGMAASMLTFEGALFTFIDKEQIEPTNNAAERALRHAVIWRKLCFGNDSEKGARFAERILTAIATLKMRGEDVRKYVEEAVAAFRQTLARDSLLAPQP
jgi:transposase